MATRYTDKQKQEVVAFVKKFDAENGRGGQSAAKKKFKINPISIKKWCVDQGYVSGPGRKKKAPAAAARAKAPKAAAKATKKTGAKRGPKKGSRRGRKPAAASSAAASIVSPTVKTGGSTAVTLRKMSTIAEKIDSLHSEFESLKKSL